MRRLTIVALIIVLSILTAVCAWGKTPRQNLDEGSNCLSNPATHARGEALLNYVIQFNPGKIEASESAWKMAEHFKGNRPQELRYYEIAMRTPGPHSEVAERSYGCVLGVVGRKNEAADLFLARANRGKDRDESLTFAYMNYLSLARTDKVNREMWRAKAKVIQDLIPATSPFFVQARRNRIGMTMEEAQNGKVPWPVVIKQADAASDDPICALMAAEACQFAKRDTEMVIYYADRGMADPTNRVAYFRSAYVKAGELLDTNPGEAVSLYGNIIENMLPADEFAGMSTVEYSLHWWSTVAVGQTREAVLEQLRVRFPNSHFLEGK